MKKTVCIFIILFLTIACQENNEKNLKDRLSISDEMYFEELYRKTYAVSPNKINSDTFSRTNLYPYIEAPIKKGFNSVYCMSFQLAWNELKRYIGDDIKLANKTNNLSLLNKSKISKNDIENNSIICVAGENIISKIKKDFKKKFNYNPNHLDNLSENLLVYAYLQKILKFKGVFKTDQVNKMNFRNQNKVLYFFYLIDTNTIKTDNIVLYDYKDDNDFIIKTKMEENNDEVYFAKVKPNSTLFETYQTVMRRVNKKRIFKLDTTDMVGIPYVNLNIRKNYYFLSGNILNSPGKRIEQAIQDVDFDLNETGITLTSSVAITRCAFETNGKKLLFDKPFLIIMKQKYSDFPYFLIWIENSELMKKNRWN